VDFQLYLKATADLVDLLDMKESQLVGGVLPKIKVIQLG
jgi:hypothetical protein